MLYLKADTSTEVTVGPAVAVGDGFTPVTSLVGASADEFELIKHGATTTTAIAGTLAAITGADGYYALDLSTSDTNTEGRLVLLINDDSLILPIRHEFMVVNANVYDSLFAAAATDYLQTDVIQIVSGAVPSPAVTGVPDVNVTHQGDGAIPAPAQTGVPDVNTTYIQDGLVPTPTTTGVPDVNVERWNDVLVVISTGLPSVRLASTDINAITNSSINDGTLVVSKFAAAYFAEISDQVWDELRSGHTTQGTYGENNYAILSGDVDTVGFTPTTTQFESSDMTEAAADFYKDRTIIFVTGTGLIGQARACTASSLQTGRTRFTVDALTVAPANTDRFIIV